MPREMEEFVTAAKDGVLRMMTRASKPKVAMTITIARKANLKVSLPFPFRMFRLLRKE